MARRSACAAGLVGATAYPSVAAAAESAGPAPRSHRHLVSQRADGARSAAATRRVRAVGDHGRLTGRRSTSGPLLGHVLLRFARDTRVRQLSRLDGSRHAAPCDGSVSLDAGQSKTECHRHDSTRRELRARAHAALYDRLGRAQPRRHRTTGCRRAADSHVFAGDHPRFRARLHGLELRRGAEFPAGPTHGYEPSRADAALSELSRYGTEARAARPNLAGRPNRSERLGRCARQHLQSPQCRAVHRAAANPAARHEQSVAAIRRTRRGTLQRQRRGCARRSRGRREGDSARCRGAAGCSNRSERQAQRTVVAPHASVARLRRSLRRGRLRRQQPERHVWPGPAAGALGVQLLQPVFRPAGRDTGGGSRRARARARDRILEHAIHELHGAAMLQPQLAFGQRAGGGCRDRDRRGGRFGGGHGRADRARQPEASRGHDVRDAAHRDRRYREPCRRHRQP